MSTSTSWYFKGDSESTLERDTSAAKAILLETLEVALLAGVRPNVFILGTL